MEHERNPLEIGEPSKVLTQLTLGKVVVVAVIIAVTWILLRFMRGFLDRMERYNPRMRFLVRQIEPPLRILIWFGGLLLAAEIVAPSKEAFLAALTSAALAIGLGLQDLIKNLIGGLIIVTDRPYQIGDRIKLSNAYGEVMQIGLRSTKIKTPDGTLVTVPNSKILTTVTYNSSGGAAESMIAAKVSLPHGSDPDEIIHIGHQVAVACPYTHLGRKIEAEIDDRGPAGRSMRLIIRAHVYDHRYEEAMKTDLMRRAKREFRARGILKQTGLPFIGPATNLPDRV